MGTDEPNGQIDQQYWLNSYRIFLVSISNSFENIVIGIENTFIGSLCTV